MTLKTGQTKKLDATVIPSNATNISIVWSSSDPSVATVDDNGNITGVLEGTAEIMATVDGKSAGTTVTVSDKPELELNSFPSVLINNVINSLSIQIYNYDDSPVKIEKVEIYEGGSLYSTYTASQLAESGISTTMVPNTNWGINVSFKLGMWIENSSVKVTVKAENGKMYEFQALIKRL